MRMNYKVIGIGAAGNKAAISLVEKKVMDVKDILLINSTARDIPKDYNGDKIILTDKGSGCGKERAIAKEYAMACMKAGELDKYIKEGESENVLIVSSVEGGTGSGAAPIIGEYCAKVLGCLVHIIAFTGFEEDVRGMKNTVEFFQELDFECDVQAIRNKAFLKLAGNNKFTAEEMANDEFIRRVKVMIGDGMVDSTQNIDDTDMFKLINTSGYKTIESIKINENLMDRSEFDRACKEMIYNSKSLFSKNPGQLRLGVIMNLSPASEDAIDPDYSVIKETYGKPFECFTHKQWDGGDQYISFISSGMKLPLDEVKSVYDRYMEASAAVNKERDTFFSELGKLEENAEDSMFDMVRSKKQNNTGSKEDFFKKFTSSAE